MIVVSTGAALRVELAYRRSKKETIALVPTMGNLHAGHMRLVQEARKRANTVVASIYVNPLQFGPTEDYDQYPRTLDKDRGVLERAGVDVLFTPNDDEMYPRGREAQTRVEVPGVSDILCGAFRPGHFRGVTTVVARLFNLAAPDIAVFGKKDYQQ
ncbi:MAG: 4-phosphopantoate--beta-alanine ligase, partial [Pseudomonadota bacterium]